MESSATQPHSARPRDLADRQIIVGVCGGIAAFKVCSVVSDLAQRGASVTVVMTRAARKFIGPMTFQALSGKPVITSLWTRDTPYEAQHIGLTDHADLLVIAPATANMIAKLAHGLADDVLSTLAMSVNCPVLLAPAMNHRMWTNPLVAENVTRLQTNGYHMVGPGSGWLACRHIGEGRMSEPADILDAVNRLLPSIGLGSKAASPDNR